jgi:hypothetical protein
MTQPRKICGKVYFEDYPEFNPTLTPREMFQAGIFGGSYFRPIKSSVTGKEYKDQHLEFSFLSDLNSELLTLSNPRYTGKRGINKYNKKAGTSLEAWEKSGWITEQDPYGWVQWYCRFYSGRRSPDDERQILRWLKHSGPKGRFRKRLIQSIKKVDGKYDDPTVAPANRQNLLQWGYELTEEDFTTSNYAIVLNM